MRHHAPRFSFKCNVTLFICALLVYSRVTALRLRRSSLARTTMERLSPRFAHSFMLSSVFFASRCMSAQPRVRNTTAVASEHVQEGATFATRQLASAHRLRSAASLATHPLFVGQQLSSHPV